MFGVCFLGLGAEGAAPAVATKRKVSDTSDNARVANFDIPVTSSPFKLRALGSTCPTYGAIVHHIARSCERSKAFGFARCGVARDKSRQRFTRAEARLLAVLRKAREISDGIRDFRTMQQRVCIA